LSNAALRERHNACLYPGCNRKDKTMPHRSFKVGDKVRWNSHGGEASGKVVEVATKDGSIGDFEYKASEDDPRYIVETDDGKQAAHKGSALERE
jgi:hypothetical protein